MDVIFLDIDGVLTDPHSHQDKNLPHEKRIKRLNKITDATGAKIVISSSHKHNPEVVPTLRQWGVTGDIVGKTQDFRENGKLSTRGYEIEQYLKSHPEVSNYVIIDDRGDMTLDQIPHLAQTKYNKGVNKKIVKKALAILGR